MCHDYPGRMVAMIAIYRWLVRAVEERLAESKPVAAEVRNRRTMAAGPTAAAALLAERLERQLPRDATLGERIRDAAHRPRAGGFGQL